MNPQGLLSALDEATRKARCQGGARPRRRSRRLEIVNPGRAKAIRLRLSVFARLIAAI